MLNRVVLLFSYSLVFMIFLCLGLSFILRFGLYLSLFVVLTCNEGFGLNIMYDHTYVLYNSLDISIYS